LIDLINVDMLNVNICHIFNSFFRSTACSGRSKFYLRKLLKRILIRKPICREVFDVLKLIKLICIKLFTTIFNYGSFN